MLPADNTQEKKSGLAYWAARVLVECDNASQGFAVDPVHDLRVAIRRCRSMADGFLTIDPDPAWRQMKKLGKGLFASLGDLRDTQVMCDWVVKLSEQTDPLRHSLLHNLRNREAAQKAAAEEAVRAFDRKQWSSLNAHLAGRTDRVTPGSLVFQHLALERWQDAHALHSRALRNRSGVGYHQLRVGIKRYRYTIENFLPERHDKWSKDLRNLQDALGEVHDFDVLWAVVKTHPGIAAPDRDHWRSRIAAERQKRLDFYRQKMLGKNSLWQQWRSDLPSEENLQKAAIEKLSTWASFLDSAFNHAVLVNKLALQIYDGLVLCGVLAANAHNRRLLEAAALLHEVGRSHGDRGHHKRAYKMIRKLKSPVGWSAEDMHAVAIVARYHRGAVTHFPDWIFAGIVAERRTELLALAGVLRLANTFDITHEGEVTSLSVTRREGVLVIFATGFQEMGPLSERLARARYLLEATCGISISIRPPLSPPRKTPPQVVERRGKTSTS